MITIEVGMKRATLVALAEQLQLAALNGDTTIEHTVYGTNNIGGEPVEISFSNDDMERDDVPADAVYVEMIRG